jgi:hypothetical protein
VLHFTGQPQLSTRNPLSAPFSSTDPLVPCPLIPDSVLRKAVSPARASPLPPHSKFGPFSSGLHALFGEMSPIWSAVAERSGDTAFLQEGSRLRASRLGASYATPAQDGVPWGGGKRHSYNFVASVVFGCRRFAPEISLTQIRLQNLLIG